MWGLALCILVLPVVEAQTGRVAGTVTDALSGDPIEGAEVRLHTTGLRAITGRSGRYFILNAPVGRHTVLVVRRGYEAEDIRNVLVRMDLTRTIDVTLGRVGPFANDAVTALEPPLVEISAIGARSHVSAEQIAALPVTSIPELLTLLPGFFRLPPNTDIVAYTDTRRNPNPAVRVRGGRAGEVLMLLDGFPVNNVVFGGPAFDVSLEAVEQIDYQRAGFEARYGNALSGIVSVATREGGTDLAGSLSYQTSALAGALGSTPDELAGFNLLAGRLSGPVPGTDNALRFMIAGRSQGGADRVLEFDDLINRPSIEAAGLAPEYYDLIPGWRAFGYDHVVDVTAKLSYYVKPAMKLIGQYTGYLRQRQPYDFDYLLTGFDYLDTPGAGNRLDSVALEGEGYWQDYYTRQQYTRAWVHSSVVQASLRTRRDLLTLRWDHALAGRWAYDVQAGWFGQRRETCSYFEGICFADNLADKGSTPSGFYLGYIPHVNPTPGTDDMAGEEAIDTYLLRAGVQGQITDHHHLSFGGSVQRDDLTFSEFQDRGACCVWVVPYGYAAAPWNAALYVQDRLEYEFATISLGLRYDVGRSGGVFFANPYNPTNGTTAREVCEGTLTGVSEVPWQDGERSGLEACRRNLILLDSAAALAQFDDFTGSRTRGQLSPRIGVSIPVSERAHVFVHAGRFGQHPVYSLAYQGSGIGTVAGDEGGGICAPDAVVPGTDQCHPQFGWGSMVPYLGNPNLEMERATSYEIGFAAEVSANVALQVVAFAREWSALTGLTPVGMTWQEPLPHDWGDTYGTNRWDTVRGPWYAYRIADNRDYQAARGIELSLSRRLSDLWGASVNYTFTEVTTNAPAPELESQWLEDENGTVVVGEMLSEVDRPHVLNAAVFVRVPGGGAFASPVLDAILRNSQVSLTFQAASGVPYTPRRLDYGRFGTRDSRNSGRVPSSFRVDAFAAKDFDLANLQVGVFVRVVNLLDGSNCQQAFASTGVCGSGIEDVSRRHGRGYAYPDTSTYFDRPHYYGSRRSVNVGARMRF